MRIISGKFKGKKLLPPTSRTTRPTSDRARETLFNILEHNPGFGSFSWAGKNVLDIFSGTGALGLEALSRGAESCTFVESDQEALRVLKGNIEAMKMSPQTKILSMDATHLPTTHSPAQVIFIDPPYEKGLVELTWVQLQQKGWVEPGSLLIIETEKKETFAAQKSVEFLLEKTIGIAKVSFLRVTY